MSLTLCLTLVLVQLVTSSEASAYPLRAPCRALGCRHLCFLHHGLPQCSCFSGFRLLSDNRTCVDEDECGGSHLCQHACVNTPGYYMCACLQGFVLRNDGRTCRSIGRYEDSSCQDSESRQAHVAVETSSSSVTSLPDQFGLPCRAEFCGQGGGNSANPNLEWSPWMPVDDNIDPELHRVLQGEGRGGGTYAARSSDVTGNARMLADSGGDDMPARGRHRSRGDQSSQALQPSREVTEGWSPHTTVAWRRRGGSPLAEVVSRWRSELRARKVKVRRKRATENDVTDLAAWNSEGLTEGEVGTKKKGVNKNMGTDQSAERKMSEPDAGRRGKTPEGETERKKTLGMEKSIEREQAEEEMRKGRTTGREEGKSEEGKGDEKGDEWRGRLAGHGALSSRERSLPSIDTPTSSPRSGDVTGGTPTPRLHTCPPGPLRGRCRATRAGGAVGICVDSRSARRRRG